MKYFCLLFIVMGVISGCSMFHKHNTIQETQRFSLNNYSEKELNQIVALTYVEYVSDSLEKGSVRISGIFKYFDSCIFFRDSVNLTLKGFDQDKQLIYLPENFFINGFGKVFFTKPTKSTDYYFSPAIIDINNKYISGQVKHRDGQTYFYGIRYLADKFYISSIQNYRDCDY